MLFKTLQENHERIIALAGYVLVPVLFILPLAGRNPVTTNYTTAINEPGSSPLFFLSVPAALIYEIVLFYLIGLPNSRTWKLRCTALAVLTFAAIFIPYHENPDAVSDIHVLCGFLVFLLINSLLFEALQYDAKLRSFYLCGLLTVFLVTITWMAVSGLSEILYGSLLSVCLTAVYIKQLRGR